MESQALAVLWVMPQSLASEDKLRSPLNLIQNSASWKLSQKPPRILQGEGSRVRVFQRHIGFSRERGLGQRYYLQKGYDKEASPSLYRLQREFVQSYLSETDR